MSLVVVTLLISLHQLTDTDTVKRQLKTVLSERAFSEKLCITLNNCQCNITTETLVLAGI